MISIRCINVIIYCKQPTTLLLGTIMVTSTIEFTHNGECFNYSHPDFEIEVTPSSINFFILEPDTYVPCDDEACPDGKELDGDELDACAETCPYLSKEKGIASAFMMSGDESLESIIKGFRRATLDPKSETGRGFTLEMYEKIQAGWLIEGEIY